MCLSWQARHENTIKWQLSTFFSLSICLLHSRISSLVSALNCSLESALFLKPDFGAYGSVRFIEMPIQFSIKWKELFALWHLSLLFFPSSLLSVSQRIKTSEVLPAIHCAGDEILIVNFKGKKINHNVFNSDEMTMIFDFNCLWQ